MWFFYSPIALPEARPWHLIEVYPSFLLCNGLPRIFAAFPHFVKLPNKGFILVDTFRAQNIRWKTFTKDLLSKYRLEMKTSFGFFPPAWGRLLSWQIILTYLPIRCRRNVHTLDYFCRSGINEVKLGLQNITRDPEYESRHSLFWCETQIKTLISFTADKSTPRDFVARSPASRP